MAQTYDANQPGTGIEGFLSTMRTNKSDIKRELDTTDDKVRIMTVHASKGLESPIVFMPDTISVPSAGKSDNGFMWIDDEIPLWSPLSKSDNGLIKQHKDAMAEKMLDEYYRLLYVGMTRAEDHLIICGALNGNQKKIPEKSWYQCIQNGLNAMKATEQEWNFDPDYEAEDAHAPYLVYETNQTAPVKEKRAHQIQIVKKDLPSWVTDPLMAEQHPPRVLKPSQDDAEAVPVRSPLLHGDDSYRFRRGLLTHSLLQYLPDVIPDERPQAAERYLKQQAPDLPVSVKTSIMQETIAILNDPQFASFFGAGSMAEVPVTGTISHENGKIDIISGQIDRLWITDDTVWIVDFKSNRPPPRNPDDVPNQYRKQLSAYKTLIKKIYPNHTIRCALLWTDGPFMTELEKL